MIQTITQYQRVALDTSIFIYAFEDHPTFSLLAREILGSIQRGATTGVTSVLSIAEVNVRPFQHGNRELARLYEAQILVFPNLQTMDVRLAIVREASRIRGQYGFNLPDAVHLATAVQHNAATFITNDRRLQQFQELPVTLLMDFVH